MYAMACVVMDVAVLHIDVCTLLEAHGVAVIVEDFHLFQMDIDAADQVDACASAAVENPRIGITVAAMDDHVFKDDITDVIARHCGISSDGNCVLRRSVICIERGVGEERVLFPGNDAADGDAKAALVVCSDTEPLAHVKVVWFCDSEFTVAVPDDIKQWAADDGLSLKHDATFALKYR